MKFRFFLFISFIFILVAASAAQDLDFSNLKFRSKHGGGTSVGQPDPNAAAASVRKLERDAFQLINTERSLAGLPTLRWSEKVAAVARLHSNNMAEGNFFSHKGLDGLMVDDRAAQVNMGPWRAIGENIAFMKGYANPVETAVEKWLQSSSHRGNMLNPQWTETAIGLAVTADGKYYFTQVFIRN